MAASNDKQWPKPDDKPSYLWAMLSSSTNIYSGLTAAAAGTLLSIPFGLGIGLIPVVGFAAGEAIAALFLPNSRTFRNNVDRDFRQNRRETIRRHLLAELDGKLRSDAREFAVYERMLERVQSIRAIAVSRDSTLSEADVERLEDSCVDYLGLIVARVLLQERRDAIDSRALENRKQTIQAQIQATTRAAERRKLQKALDDLEAVLASYHSLENRQLAIDAAMLSMPDTLEEIYHNIITNPRSATAADYLKNAVERLRLEEELDYSMQTEVDDLPVLRQVMAAKSKSVAQE